MPMSRASTRTRSRPRSRHKSESPQGTVKQITSLLSRQVGSVGANIGKEGRSIRSLAAADMAEGMGQATALLKREFGVSIPIDKIP
eukprot:893073-Prymnesium_polylepis.2